jgi:hypothetical protein
MATDFHEWAFESAGTNPLGWQQSAKDLLEAADAVRARVVDVFDGGMHSLAAVQAMLVGMALECLLKGMWIKKHKAWKRTVLGLTFRRKKPKVPNGKGGFVGDHELLQLADAAGVSLRQGERAVLQRLSGFIKWGGRYPIPTMADQMKPSSTGGGPAVAANYVSVQELKLAEELARRLMTDVEPWRP